MAWTWSAPSSRGSSHSSGGSTPVTQGRNACVIFTFFSLAIATDFVLFTNKKNKRKIIILKLNNLVVWSIGKAGRIHLMLALGTGEALPATSYFSLNNQRETKEAVHLELYFV
jgi:hypothetical protein